MLKIVKFVQFTLNKRVENSQHVSDVGENGRGVGVYLDKSHPVVYPKNRTSPRMYITKFSIISIILLVAMWALTTDCALQVRDDVVILPHTTTVTEIPTGERPGLFVKRPALHPMDGFIGRLLVKDVQKGANALTLAHLYATERTRFEFLVREMKNRTERRVLSLMRELYDKWIQSGKPPAAAIDWIPIIKGRGRFVVVMNKYLALSKHITGRIRFMRPTQLRVVRRNKGVPVYTPFKNTHVVEDRAATVLRESFNILSETRIPPESEHLLPRVHGGNGGNTGEPLMLLHSTDISLKDF